MNAIIIHGMPSKEEYVSIAGYKASAQHWIPWLSHELIKRGIHADTPEMPKPYAPSYKDWCAVFEQFEITNDTILVGHSCGAGFLVRWLSEHPVLIKKLVLVAPWIDPEKTLSTDFFNFVIDTTLVSRIGSIVVLYGDTDEYDVLVSVDELKATLPGGYYSALPGKGHCTYEDMGTIVFPELLEVVLSSFDSQKKLFIQ